MIMMYEKFVLQESKFKKPAKNLNFGIINQSAALIQVRSQSKQSYAEDRFSAGNFSRLDLPVQKLSWSFGDKPS